MDCGALTTNYGERLHRQRRCGWRPTPSIPACFRLPRMGGGGKRSTNVGSPCLVTREYEHLIVAMTATDAGPLVTFMPLPHPSGIAVNRTDGGVYVASTRNPNQVFEFRGAVAPTVTWEPRGRRGEAVAAGAVVAVSGPTLPARSGVCPGSAVRELRRTECGGQARRTGGIYCVVAAIDRARRPARLHPEPCPTELDCGRQPS